MFHAIMAKYLVTFGSHFDILHFKVNTILGQPFWEKLGPILFQHLVTLLSTAMT